MPTAYSYIRFSSTKQKLGDSHRRQAEEAEAWAQKNGYDLNTDYKDLGVSAFKGKNRKEGALALFIKRVEEGLIPNDAILVVEAMDRLSREEPHTALRKFLELIDLGLTIVTLTDMQVYSVERTRKDGGMSLFFSIGQIIGAHSQSKLKSDRVKTAYTKRLAKAIAGEGVTLTGICPGWLKRTDKAGMFEVIPERVETLKRMFALCIAGEGGPSIAKILNMEGRSTFGNDLTKEWSQGTVNAALNNPATYGNLRRRDPTALPAKGYYPAIVDEATFNAAQAGMAARQAMSGRRTERTVQGLDGPKIVKHVNILAGLMWCQCGTRLRMTGTTNKNDNYYVYLRCPRTIETAKCKAPPFKLLDIENCVLQRLLDFKGLRLMQGITPQPDDSTAELRAAISQKREGLQRLISLAAVAGDIEAIGKQVKAMQAAIVAAEKNLKKMESVKAVSEDDILDASRLWINMQNEIMTPEDSYALRLKLQTAIRRFVVKLVIRNDKRTIDATLSAAVYGKEMTGQWDYVAVNAEIEGRVEPTAIFDKPAIVHVGAGLSEFERERIEDAKAIRAQKPSRSKKNTALVRMLANYDAQNLDQDMKKEPHGSL